MRRAVRNPVLLVVAGFLLMQAAWILTVPPFRGSDEIDHTYRAAAVARGEWVAGPPAKDGRGELVTVPQSIVDAAQPQCKALPYMEQDNCEPVSRVSDDDVLVASAAGSYVPVYYWLVGTAGRPFDGADALLVMRAASSLLCLVFVGVAAWALGKLPGRWPLAALLLAGTPVLVYSSTLVAPNGLEMCAALALWSTLLAMTHDQQPSTESRLLWAAIASAVVVAGLRQLGPVFVLMIVATVALMNWSGLWACIRRNARSVAIGAVLVAAAVSTLAAWTLWAMRSGEGEAEAHSDMGIAHLVVWPMQSIAAFPFRDQMGAMVVYPVVGSLTLALVVVALRSGVTRHRLVLAASIGVALLFPVAFTLATSHSIGNIWQGRYGLPYAVGFVLLAGYATAVAMARRPLPLMLTIPALSAYGVAIAACWIKVRNNELANNAASAADGSWVAPEPFVLVLIAATVAVLFVLALSVAGDRPEWGRSEPLSEQSRVGR